MESPDDEQRDDGKETVIQFLEKTRMFEDPTWSSQRGMILLQRNIVRILTASSNHEGTPYLAFHEDDQAFKEAQ